MRDFPRFPLQDFDLDTLGGSSVASWESHLSENDRKQLAFFRDQVDNAKKQQRLWEQKIRDLKEKNGHEELIYPDFG